MADRVKPKRSSAKATRHASGSNRKVPQWETWTSAELNAIDTVLRNARPSEVTAAFARIRPNFAKSTWLAKGHPIGEGTKGATRHPFDLATSSSIAEYAAASVPLHVSDAWTYFGRAMHAIASGSIEVAQHLLYYSELRAMHALLFRHGVVLLNKQNLSITAAGIDLIPFPREASRIASNAHQSIWVLFRHWIKTDTATRFYADSLKLRGESLAKWTSERPLPVTLKSTIAPIMERWGMDVAQFSYDRELRNQLSYNPTRLNIAATGVTPAFVSNLYQQVWMLLEPASSNAFESLDQYIMRDAFQLFTARDPNGKGVRVPREFSSTNEFWVEKVLGSGGGKSIVDFLDRPSEWPSPAILRSASQDLTSAHLADQITGMVGRAIILLRIATGATKDLLVSAGCSIEDVDFWLEDMLTLHGIRVPAGPPRAFIDLYDGISDLVDDLGLLSDENDPGEMALVAEQLAEQVHALSGFERVAAWAVA